jgi:hypothetical protein
LESVKHQVTPKGHLVSGEVVQEGEIYEAQVKGKVEMSEGGMDLLIDISKRKNSFSIDVPKVPSSLTLDPDHHIFRRLYPEEIIPGLNAMLEDSGKIFVIPHGGDEERRKIYAELARITKERKGGEILPEREMTEEKILNSSVMLLGESWKHPLFSKLISKIPSPVVLKEDNFIVDGEKVDGGEKSLLLTYPHPLRPGKWVTIYLDNRPKALQARYIFFYGWDIFLLRREAREERVFHVLSFCDFAESSHQDAPSRNETAR